MLEKLREFEVFNGSYCDKRAEYSFIYFATVFPFMRNTPIFIILLLYLGFLVCGAFAEVVIREGRKRAKVREYESQSRAILKSLYGLRMCW
ncbi:hypothetical protein [Bartonella tribocorum]|uniref:Uncharacterized protein n=1 Tax=Bartonella tribocorum TaxID=85701 RepID=A0A2M6USF4_9HYPH|nr:hypothetical protein [Bartonella tribocorum]PIT69093.1 hypothetical protein CER18_04595 [Bartonella tribocorum]